MEANYKLDSLIRELHLAYNKRTQFIEIIDKNKDFYINNKINISPIYDWDNENIISLSTEQRKLDKLKITFIKGYNHITVHKIPYLLNEIKIYNLIRNVPYPIYNTIQSIYMTEVCNHIIKGNTFNIGKYLGSIGIRIIKNNPDYRYNGINWSESNKLRKQLEENGCKIQTKDNPNGIPYLIKYYNEETVLIKWFKVRSEMINKYKYKFRPMDNNNYSIINLNPKSVDDILNNKGLGMFEKISAIRMYFPNYTENWTYYE